MRVLSTFHNFPLLQREDRRSPGRFHGNQRHPGPAPCQSWAPPARAALPHPGVPDLFLCPATQCRTPVAFPQSPALKAATHAAATAALQTPRSPANPPRSPRPSRASPTHLHTANPPAGPAGVSPRQRRRLRALAERADPRGSVPSTGVLLINGHKPLRALGSPSRGRGAACPSPPARFRTSLRH